MLRGQDAGVEAEHTMSRLEFARIVLLALIISTAIVAVFVGIGTLGAKWLS